MDQIDLSRWRAALKTQLTRSALNTRRNIRNIAREPAHVGFYVTGMDALSARRLQQDIRELDENIQKAQGDSTDLGRQHLAELQHARSNLVFARNHIVPILMRQPKGHIDSLKAETDLMKLQNRVLKDRSLPKHHRNFRYHLLESALRYVEAPKQPRIVDAIQILWSAGIEAKVQIQRHLPRAAAPAQAALTWEGGSLLDGEVLNRAIEACKAEAETPEPRQRLADLEFVRDRVVRWSNDFARTWNERMNRRRFILEAERDTRKDRLPEPSRAFRLQAIAWALDRATDPDVYIPDR